MKYSAWSIISSTSGNGISRRRRNKVFKQVTHQSGGCRWSPNEYLIFPLKVTTSSTFVCCILMWFSSWILIISIIEYNYAQNKWPTRDRSKTYGWARFRMVSFFSLFPWEALRRSHDGQCSVRIHNTACACVFVFVRLKRNKTNVQPLR